MNGPRKTFLQTIATTIKVMLAPCKQFHYNKISGRTAAPVATDAAVFVFLRSNVHPKIKKSEYMFEKMLGNSLERRYHVTINDK